MESKEEYYLTRGKILFEEDNYEEAIKYFNKVLDLNINNFLANYLKGLALCKLNQIDNAIENLKVVSKSSEDFMIQQQANLILGYIYSTKNLIDIAIEYFEKVVQTGLEASAAYNALAALYHKKNDYKKAIIYAKKALELKPDNFNAMNTLAYLLIDSGIDPKKGLEFAKKALEEDPENPARLDTVGLAYLKLGNIETAKKYFTKAYEKLPKDLEIKKHLDFVKSR